MSVIENKQQQVIIDLFSEHSFIETVLPHVTEKKIIARSKYFFQDVVKNTNPNVLQLSIQCMERFISLLNEKLGDKRFKCYFLIIIANVEKELKNEEIDPFFYYDLYHTFSQYISRAEFSQREQKFHDFITLFETKLKSKPSLSLSS